MVRTWGACCLILCWVTTTTWFALVRSETSPLSSPLSPVLSSPSSDSPDDDVERSLKNANTTKSTMVHDDVTVGRTLLVDGTIADPTKFPFFALTAGDGINSTTDNICGATLIHPDILISAAHCHGFFNYGVRLYNQTSQQYDRMARIVEQIRHPNFNLNNANLNWDILLMRLETPIVEEDLAVPSSFASLNRDPNLPSTTDLLTAVGFGFLTWNGPLSDILRQAEFHAITPTVCNQRVQNYGIRGVSNGPDVLCADAGIPGQSICLGDSGGPLITRTGVLVGVTSFTYECQYDQIPDGFARISFFYDWIQEQLCGMSVNPPTDKNYCTQDTQSTTTTKSSNDSIPMQLNFRYDSSPEETTFAVRNLDTHTIDYAGPHYVVPERGLNKTWTSYFNLSVGNYAFEVYDSRHNGMTDTSFGAGPGSWQLYVITPQEGGSNKDNKTNNNLILVASGGGAFLKESITDFHVQVVGVAGVPIEQPQPPTPMMTTTPPDVAVPGQLKTLQPSLSWTLSSSNRMDPSEWAQLSREDEQHSSASSTGCRIRPFWSVIWPTPTTNTTLLRLLLLLAGTALTIFALVDNDLGR